MKMQLDGFSFTGKGEGLDITRLCCLLLSRAAASARIKNALKNLGLLIEKYLPGTKSVIAAQRRRGRKSRGGGPNFKVPTSRCSSPCSPLCTMQGLCT